MAAAKTKGAAKRRPSGPSGRNTKPGILLRATEEEFQAWLFVADQEEMTLTAWIREACNEASQFVGKELTPQHKAPKKRR